jgi:hypothetical protein
LTKLRQRNLTQENGAGEMIDSEEKFRIIAFEAYKKNIADIWEILQAEKREAILIKGFAAAQNYPKPYLRSVGDIDIAVNPEQYQSTLDLLRKQQIGQVDLHDGLRNLDLSDWKTLYKNSRPVSCAGTEIRVPASEDHLRVLIVHWLIDGGINKKKLWDIYYAVENRPLDFDWDYFLNGVGKKRRKWLTCTIGLAHKYLRLNVEDTPIAEEVKDIPEWIIKTVEKEWESTVNFSYLHINLTSAKQFFEQLKKRIPPNPIQSTVNMEGEFDNGTRVFYQVGDMAARFGPSVKRVSRVIINNLKYRKKRSQFLI